MTNNWATKTLRGCKIWLVIWCVVAMVLLTLAFSHQSCMMSCDDHCAVDRNGFSLCWKVFWLVIFISGDLSLDLRKTVMTFDVHLIRFFSSFAASQLWRRCPADGTKRQEASEWVNRSLLSIVHRMFNKLLPVSGSWPSYDYILLKKV